MLPGQAKPVENNNKDFIEELGERVVSVDWFLGRSKDPYIKGSDSDNQVDSSSSSASVSSDHSKLKVY